MSKLTILTAAVAMFGLPVLSMPGAASAAEIAQVFEFYCSQCHGLEGKGDGPNVSEEFPVSPRNFTSAEEMSKLSDADIKNVIMDGGPAMSKSEMMPPWSKTLTEADVDGLILHLRKLCACEGK